MFDFRRPAGVVMMVAAAMLRGATSFTPGLATTSAQRWRLVMGADNPVDSATRRGLFTRIGLGVAAAGAAALQLQPGKAEAAVYPEIKRVISTPATLPNRSPFELQYEMFKNGMDLEGDEDFVAAEQQWTEIIEELDTPAWRESSSGNKYLLARAHANRGGARASLGRQREAILDYSQALNLVPDRCEFWLSRGMAYEGLADEKLIMDAASQGDVRVFYESALSDYDRALVLDPMEPQVYIMRGDVLALLQDHREALDSYRRGLMLNPNKPDLKCRVALAEIQCGNLGLGAAMVGSILNSSPERPDMLLAGAALAWEAGELVESEAMYKMAITQDSRLMDDRFIINALKWPAVPVSMVKVLRRAGTMNRLAAVRTLIGDSI